MNFSNIFAESLDTFKVFDNLEVTNVGERLPNSPKTIWQILNHLTAWQAHQLGQLMYPSNQATFHESLSWISEKTPDSQQELKQSVQQFYTQIEDLKKLLCQLTQEEPALESKLKIIQHLTSHLAFHVGEVVHLRRILGEYPQPEHMQEFLADEK
jgi:uncharacterized damage-inducible protein DinB